MLIWLPCGDSVVATAMSATRQHKANELCVYLSKISDLTLGHANSF